MTSEALIRPTDLLRCEHAVILDALEKLEALTDQLCRGECVRADRAVALTDFLVSYVDHFHHEKEERLLFPALRDAGMPDDMGPLPAMRREHEAGRAFVQDMVSAAVGGLEDIGAFVGAARSFVELMRIHIRKENNALFTAAEDMLDEATKRHLLAAFRARGTQRPFREWR